MSSTGLNKHGVDLLEYNNFSLGNKEKMISNTSCI